MSFFSRKNLKNGKEYLLHRRYEPASQVEKWSELKDGRYLFSSTDNRTDREVNIIIHQVPYSKTSTYAKIVRELELCVKLCHKNIVMILNIFTPQITSADFVYFYVAYEHMDYTLKYLRDHRAWLLPGNKSSGAERLSFIAYQLICGIDYLHKAGIVHRDLRPSNILLNKQCQIKIANLGNARHFSEIAALPDSEESPGYWGPEIYQEITKKRAEELAAKGHLNDFKPTIPPNLSSDIWALGIILFEIVGDQNLFPDLKIDTPNGDTVIADRMRQLPDLVGASLFPDSTHMRLNPEKGLYMFQTMTHLDPCERLETRKLLSLEYIHWVRLPGDLALPPVSCITVGIDKIDFSAGEWRENLFRMIKDYERTHDTGEWTPVLPEGEGQASSANKTEQKETPMETN